jgi:photosystem II stability/assembly factor-like uncharacterized protein
VPAGFTPASFTAVSGDDYWVLGTAPCRNPVCTSIVRTTNGGESFVGIPAPVVALASPTSTVPTISQLRFADALDGFAYGVAAGNTGGPGTAFYVTHDGGATWHALDIGDVLAFATGGGTAYALTARCSASGCVDDQLRRSPVGADSWSTRPLPFDVTPGSTGLVLGVHDGTVWIMGPSGPSLGRAVDTIARSVDGGDTFSEASAPCTPDLPADLEPSSDAVLWAFCPTGNRGQAFRSSDGGATFAALPYLQLANSAVIAPASDTTAVLSDPGNGTLLRTTDAGRTWTTVSAPGPGHAIAWIGFTDRSTGAALVQSDATAAQTLWRTTDGGVDWSQVVFATAPAAEVPTLGRRTGAFVNGEGFGQVEPTVVFNGGDPTGYVGGITWQSWGGARAVGTGTSDYVGPQQTVAQGTQEPVTVVAFDLGTCDGSLMYQAVEWYFPQHGQTFDPDQYENICTGTDYPPVL